MKVLKGNIKIILTHNNDSSLASSINSNTKAFNYGNTYSYLKNRKPLKNMLLTAA